MRVAGDHIHQPAALIGGQRLARGSLLHQLQRRFQFGGVLLEAFAIQAEALGQMLAQHPGGPLAEARALDRLDPVTDGDDHVEVVVIDLVGFAVRGSMCKICTYCRTLKLTLGENIADVLGDHRALAAEQQAHLLLGEPDRFTIQPHFDTDVVAFVDDDF